MTIASLLRKKWLLAVIAAAVVGSAAYAFAATLTTNSKTLGAGNAAVTSCADSVTASYANGYDSASSGTGGKFAVKSVTLTFGSGTTCASGDTIQAVLTGASNAPLASFVYTVGSAASGTLASKTVVVNAGSTTVDASSTATDAGTLAAGSDGSDFTAAGDAITSSSAVAADAVTGVAVSAAGAAS